MFCKIDVLINVFQQSQESAQVGVSFLINMIAGLQLQVIFIENGAPVLVFSERLISFESKKHCYKKHRSDICQKINHETFYLKRPQYFCISGSGSGLYKLLSVEKISKTIR